MNYMNEKIGKHAYNKTLVVVRRANRDSLRAGMVPTHIAIEEEYQ